MVSLQQGVCKPSVPRGGDRVVRKYATGLGLDRGYSAHPMRASAVPQIAKRRGRNGVESLRHSLALPGSHVPGSSPSALSGPYVLVSNCGRAPRLWVADAVCGPEP
jgi:hypothetical protein